MKPAPLPIDEATRLQDLLRYQILDTAEEKDYNDLVHLAADICRCPISSITFVDADRQWFKASINMPDKETSRDVSFCSHAILQKDVMIVEDASKDRRFADYPNVTGGILIRFYAGALIVSEHGQNLGTLCVIDTKARKLDKSQEHALQTMAGMVSRLLELRINTRMLVNTSNELVKSVISYQELFDLASIAQWIYDTDADRFIAANQVATRLYGYSEQEFEQLKLTDILSPDSDPAKTTARLALKKSATIVTSHRKKDGSKVMVEATLSTITDKGNNLIVASLTDLSEKLQLQKDLIEEKKQLTKQMETAALSAQLKERDFLGKELHDNISQMLSSTNIYLDIAYADDDLRMDLIQKSQENLMATIDQVRSLSRRLVNTPTEGTNLEQAIHDMLQPYTASARFKVHYTVEGDVNSLPVDMKTSLLRVAQEAMHNIAKYAEPSNVWISLDAGKKFSMQIRDDGRGFDQKEFAGGIGLKNMRERIERLKGTFTLKAKPGSGTTIKVVLSS